MNDNAVFNDKRWKMVRVTDVISSNYQGKKESQINDFISFPKKNKEKDNSKHLNSDEHIFSIKTEWISLVNAVSGG